MTKQFKCKGSNKKKFDEYTLKADINFFWRDDNSIQSEGANLSDQYVITFSIAYMASVKTPWNYTDPSPETQSYYFLETFLYSSKA